MVTRANKHIQICGFCIKSWPIREVTHLPPDCPRLKVINKFRGNFPPVEVEEGYITWIDREPTPDPEEVVQRTIARLEEKVDALGKQNALILEKLAELQKGNAEGSKKASKKKASKAKAKESQD